MFKESANVGGRSIPHKSQTPFFDSPLQPSTISFPSKLKTNLHPSSNFISAILRVYFTKPMGISDGKPISSFSRVGIEMIGKLNSPNSALYFPLAALLLIT